MWVAACLGDFLVFRASRRFLAFVTSCSKAPLMGFANLHPPMCIRMAEDDGPVGGGEALARYSFTFPSPPSFLSLTRALYTEPVVLK